MSLPSILIVDDEPFIVETLAASLEDDADIHFALSGHEALAYLHAHPAPDLILLDIMLPDLDGYALHQQLCRQPVWADIPLIFVTALQDKSAETRALDAGAVDFITKPICADVVRARVMRQLALADKRRRWEQLALTDPLTGLANRRQFDAALQQATTEARLHTHSVSLILLDIDHFKRFNDHYGHPQGDICLQRIACTLQTLSQPPAGLVARVGGEEFAVLLPGTDRSEATAMAEMLRHTLNQLAIPHATSPVCDHVTLSLGVATYSPSIGTGDNLYVEADRLLYQAKEWGRNRAVASA